MWCEDEIFSVKLQVLPNFEQNIFEVLRCSPIFNFFINPSRPNPGQIEKKVKLGLHKTFWGTTKKRENKKLN